MLMQGELTPSGHLAMTMLRASRNREFASVNAAEAIVHESLAAFNLPSIKSITPSAMVANAAKAANTITLAGNGSAQAAAAATVNDIQVASAVL